MEQVIFNINQVILWYFLVISIIYMVLLLTSIPMVLIRDYYEFTLGETFNSSLTDNAIPITVVIPTYNEEENVLNCVQSVLNSSYKNVKVIAVNDGSTDTTLDLLIKHYDMHEEDYLIRTVIPTQKVKKVYRSRIYPNLLVIDKENGRTGDALNVGVNAAQTPFFMTLDADSMVEIDTITRLMYTMLINKHVIAVGGGVYILNNCHYENGFIKSTKLKDKYVTNIQSSEYIRTFLFVRTGWNAFKGAMSFSGTCTLFEHESVMNIGGFANDNPAQDTEIIVMLHEYMRQKKHPYQILFTPSAITWTLVPDTFREFGKQRITWQRGIMISFCRHLNMLFNPRYGITGLFTYPFYLLADGLSPIIELTTYVLIIISLFLGFFDYKSALIFLLLTVGFQAFLTMATLAMNIMSFKKYYNFADLVKMFLFVFLEFLGFRQYLLCCETIGIFKYLFSQIKIFGMRLFTAKHPHP